MIKYKYSLYFLINLIFLTSCGTSVLDRCIEENEKNYNESFEDMSIELTTDDMKRFVEEMNEFKELMMKNGIEDHDYRHIRLVERVQQAWSRNDFDQIQNIYLSDEYGADKTYGQLKDKVEKGYEGFVLDQTTHAAELWDLQDDLLDAETTYEKISVLDNNNFIDDPETNIYLRVYNENNFKDNRRKYAKNLCHSQGVY